MASENGWMVIWPSPGVPTWVSFGSNPGSKPTSAPTEQMAYEGKRIYADGTGTGGGTGTIPPKPGPFFSPYTAEERALIDAWNAQYGSGAGTDTGTDTDGGTGTGTDTGTDTGGGGDQLPGYGTSQILNGFGIPGYETKPVTGGGSWAGTTWTGAPYSGFYEAPIPNSDVTNPNSPYYRPPTQNDDGSAINPGSTNIQPAVPYDASWYLQKYGGKAPPYLHAQEQLGAAMKGIEAAMPGFNWASPQALAALKGVGLPGGWTTMLGFTPGGSK